jgi:hypothetical protein
MKFNGAGNGKSEAEIIRQIYALSPFTISEFGRRRQTPAHISDVIGETISTAPAQRAAPKSDRLPKIFDF